MDFQPTHLCEGCPLSEKTRLVLEHGGQMVGAIRMLRDEIEAEGSCLHYQICPVLDLFNAAVREAVQAVADYWNLESYAAEQGQGQEKMNA